ncbi:class I SAM-dependent DNA methyltransferase [Alienimonas sp. DA493]|uniref:class I SAM-dependent DNA methyltransferase n=1 Tax=Alienimonas sp. DA493 TaxID=3373605 RepID=UPI003754655A
MPQRHHVRFPSASADDLAQDEVRFEVVEGDRPVRLRFHDYDEIYRRPGLYEQVFYDRLRCCSPAKVGDLLRQTLAAVGRNVTELRVLDLGAGNGMMGDVLKTSGVARLVGADIIPEAREACYRDRPGLYDDYFVADFTNLPQETADAIDAWSIDCLTTVAALGFGDIPPEAFLRALDFVKPDGWAAFNIKETFLDNSDRSGFSRCVRRLIASGRLDVHHLERYQHRLSMEGTPLHYYAIVARKRGSSPLSGFAGNGDDD